jgi:two-component system NarL family sensor kinase
VTRLPVRAGDGRALILALVRVALLPAIVVGERLIDHPGVDLDLFEAALTVAGIYGVLALAVTLLAPRIPLPWFLPLDFAVLAFLTYASGGALASTRLVLTLPPFLAAFLGRPRHTLGIALLALAVYVGVAALHPSVGVSPSTGEAAQHLLDQAWFAALAVAMSVYVSGREDRIRALAASRGALVAQAMHAEERARRQLAYVLHDEVVQTLLSTVQDLKAAERGRAGCVTRARETLDATVAQLRREIAGLHPHQLESLGLGAAIEEVAQQKARMGGFRVAVDVAPEAAAIHDDLVLSLARELLQNAARHAGAETVRVDVGLEDGAVVLRCADDGCGVDPVRRERAVREGHLGLAACTERVEAIGGTFEVVTGPGVGTVVRAVLPRGGAEPLAA